jgi:DNA-binding transcriptional LysR family regulator
LFPAVTYAIQYAPLSNVADRVASGQFDIGISFCQKAPAGTRIAATANFPSGAVLSVSHPLAKKDLVTFEECREYPIFQTGVNDELPSPLSLEYSRHWEETKVHMQSNSIGLIKSMVARGRGIAFFTKLGFIDELDRGEVVWRPIAGVSDNTPPVAILVPSPKELSPIGEEYLNCLIRCFKQFEALTQNGH